MPEPGIVITRAHIANALDLKRDGLVSERDLVHWAPFCSRMTPTFSTPATKTSSRNG